MRYTTSSWLMCFINKIIQVSHVQTLSVGYKDFILCENFFFFTEYSMSPMAVSFFSAASLYGVNYPYEYFKLFKNKNKHIFE